VSPSEGLSNGITGRAEGSVSTRFTVGTFVGSAHLKRMPLMAPFTDIHTGLSMLRTTEWKLREGLWSLA